jgi:hypothetical protein
MAELTDVLNGYAYDLYTKLTDTIPTDVSLVEELPFDKQNEQGGDYNEQIVTAEEAGVVYGDPTEMLTAPTAVGLETVKATVNGYQIGLVSTLDYAKAQRASSGRKSYADIAGKKQASAFNAIRRRLEDELWYGQEGLGKIASRTNVDATNSRYTMTLSTFAPWLWAGKKNHQLVAYNGTTRVGTGFFTITKTDVNRATRTVTVTAASGDITALDSAVNSNPDVLDFYPGGVATAAITWKTMVGVMKAAGTTTGTLFGVNLDANSDAAPNAYGAAGAMSFSKGMEIAELLIGRGVVEPIRLSVNPRTWNNMMQDQAALRKFGGQEKKLSNGAQALEFYTQGVSLEIVGEGRMKEGSALARPKSGLKRIGARDISMVTPGGEGAKAKGDIWYHDPSRFGYSWRIWTHQAFFPEEPWKLCKVTGIVNV